MFDIVMVFVAQFVLIFLLGIQSLNVNRGHYFLAGLTSLMLGVVGFYITGTVAAAHKEGMYSGVWWAFIIGGPLGIITSMKLHPIIHRWMKK